MVTLYVAGKPVGTLADLDRVMRWSAETWGTFEFRDAAGRRLGTYTPAAVDELADERLPPFVPPTPPTGPWLTTKEMFDQLGWDYDD